MDLPFYREYDLPWTSGSDQERKFRRLLGQVVLAVAVLGLVWPFIPTPEPDPYEIEEIPPRIAQLAKRLDRPERAVAAAREWLRFDPGNRAALTILGRTAPP